jgi:type II secretory pathway pseudopilin PulG
MSRRNPSRVPRRLSAEAGISLVELLVGMIIMSVITTMLIMGWTAISNSMSNTVSASEARDFSRLAIDRLTREIRDAETPSNAYLTSAGLPLTSPAVLRARQTWIAFFTTFNVAGSMPTVTPRLVVYRLYSDGSIWRYVDVDGNGRNGSLGTWANSVNALTNGTSTQAVETTAWEGGQLVVPAVVNSIVPDANHGTSTTDLFRYSYNTSSGVLGEGSPVLTDDLRVAITSVQIHMLVDLNPSHSPVYIDLLTTAQLRNAH